MCILAKADLFVAKFFENDPVKRDLKTIGV
jgi:hypothetical protein